MFNALPINGAFRGFRMRKIYVAHARISISGTSNYLKACDKFNQTNYVSLCDSENQFELNRIDVQRSAMSLCIYLRRSVNGINVIKLMKC